MFSDIGNWNGIILAILSAFLFLLAFIQSLESEDVPHDENSLISKESRDEARKQMRAKPW